MIHTKIDGKAQHIFVLRDGEERMVFIPVDALDKSDFGRLYELDKKTSKSTDLLSLLLDETLSNGSNAMNHFKRVICLATKGEEQYQIEEDGTRTKKPTEESSWDKQPAPSMQELMEIKAQLADLQVQNDEANARLTTMETRKKPGPKPKSKAKSDTKSDSGSSGNSNEG